MDNSAKNARGCLLVFMIPIGVFLFAVFFELGNSYYWQKRLDKDLEQFLTEALTTESIDTKEEYQDYIERQLKEDGFEKYKVTITYMYEPKEDCEYDSDSSTIDEVDEHICDTEVILASAQIEHFSVTGYVTYVIGQTNTDTKFTISKYTGYLDDYSEPIVEKVVIEIDEDDKVYTDEELQEMNSSN